MVERAVDARGFVETPAKVVDLMVEKLFHWHAPQRHDELLDPGCGTGAFIGGVIRWCDAHSAPIPRVLGIEFDQELAAQADARFRGRPEVHIVRRDFLVPDRARYDYIIGNPPYVPIYDFTDEEKAQYRSIYATARGRFDLYLLFFERALKSLKSGGRLVFITPEKYVFVETAEPLRRLLASLRLEEIHFLPEDTFGELVTYPTVTTVRNERGTQRTTVRFRDGREARVRLPSDGGSWQPLMNGRSLKVARHILDDLCVRISCGVATGADSVFVVRSEDVAQPLRRWAYPTIAGRELTPEHDDVRTKSSMLVPYDRDGRLLPPERVRPLIQYLFKPERMMHLTKRTVVRRKPWYAFHENPPLRDLLRPKILCKDVTERPRFWVDREGTIVPRHSVYYLVPRDPSRMDELAAYLNSPRAADWLGAHCQRAANGFLRVQSQVLRRLPIPESLLPDFERAPRIPVHASPRAIGVPL